MFTAKKLKKMAPHGLTFGEHCVDLQAQLFLLKVLFFLKYKQIETVLMRNPV
jgi:hypothetical protein